MVLSYFNLLLRCLLGEPFPEKWWRYRLVVNHFNVLANDVKNALFCKLIFTFEEQLVLILDLNH